MASKKVLTDAFIDQFSSFLGELAEMYPDDPDFAMFKTTFSIFKMTPFVVVKYVKDNVLKFEDQIMKKDETFFMNYDFAEYQSDMDMNVFHKLRQYVTTMSPASKESVWKYIQNIIRLAKAI